MALPVVLLPLTSERESARISLNVVVMSVFVVTTVLR